MVIITNQIYHAYTGSRNSLIIAPHATMSDVQHTDADPCTGWMAMDVSERTDVSFLIGVQRRNKDYRGSHDFNDIESTDISSVGHHKSIFRKKAESMVEDIVAVHEKAYIINLHCMDLRAKGGPRESALDVGTGEVGQEPRSNTLDHILLGYASLLGDIVTLNGYFAARKPGNVIHWFDRPVEAVQLEFRYDFMTRRYTLVKEFLSSVIADL
ncbi:hypothetical protein COV93_07900 [Candidatus Woesearchaeota archaeon CG11_big_fil_rev_8_21_14_0_20_43_8]|nr:MAG: hypothetical protein COV93_07900 [Candidatus Woesearchaeota archaeon CG11_big_fil_rev_8_21_14_0_20_43_8]PIO05518.1 MAG: hypothetical protein COT47_04410 [Candidatus Woesearchaeota archaeon CG08_land_8_20_14_0_20_43_7]